jgi:acid phosphatase
VPAFSHIFIIVMENKEFDRIIGSADAPYLNSLAARYGLATQYYALTHPSLPNYLALIGGSIFGNPSNCIDCFFNAPNLADQIEASGRTWKSYQESMPRPCTLGDAYPYAQRHNPFVYFDNIRLNTARCLAHVVPFTEFVDDLARGTLPHYVWITPDLCHDMHDCDVATGDAWLAQVVPSILDSTAYRNNGVLFITWDEGSTTAGCCGVAAGGRIVTLVLSPLGKPSFQSAIPTTHYSLLRTVEDAWGLAPLGGAANSAPMSEYFLASANPTSSPTPTPRPSPSSTPSPIVPTTPGPSATTVGQVVCTPRPSVGVTSTPTGDGRLLVTLFANTSGGTVLNRLQSLEFTRLDNAVVEIGSQVGVTGTYTLAPPVPAIALYLRRVAPGAASTAALVVRDGCGDWPTLIGGGPSAF